MIFILWGFEPSGYSNYIFHSDFTRYEFHIVTKYDILYNILMYNFLQSWITKITLSVINCQILFKYQIFWQATVYWRIKIWSNRLVIFMIQSSLFFVLALSAFFGAFFLLAGILVVVYFRGYVEGIVRSVSKIYFNIINRRIISIPINSPI